MSIIIKPILTEKIVKANEKIETFNTNLAGKVRKTKRKTPLIHKEKGLVYGFVVDKKANKLEIKAEVESRFNVKVEEVRTQNYFGKAIVKQTIKGLSRGHKGACKKAIVELQVGEAIDFYANI